jgi:hypothetical protein
MWSPGVEEVVAMADVIVERVESLEVVVTGLASLPEEIARQGKRLEGVEGRLSRVERQIVQLRAEMHDEFSAIRSEFRSELASQHDELTKRMLALFKESNRHATALVDGLRAEMRGLFKQYFGPTIRSTTSPATRKRLRRKR